MHVPVECAMFDIAEVAELFGVSERTVWRWVERKQLPGVFQIGKVVRFNKRIVMEFIETGGTPKPAPEDLAKEE